MAIDKLDRPFDPEEVEGSELEIVIENPDSVSLLDEEGGMVIDFDPDSSGLLGDSHDSNLVEFMGDDELYGLASELVSQFDADRQSRSDWEDSYVRGLDLLGLKFEDRSSPWEGACGVFHPML